MDAHVHGQGESILGRGGSTPPHPDRLYMALHFIHSLPARYGSRCDVRSSRNAADSMDVFPSGIFVEKCGDVVSMS